MATVKVYLVGGPEAAKENSWDLMTDDKDGALEFLEKIPDGQIKIITVTEKDTNG